MSLLLTCEHAGARVPRRWRERFRGEEALLASHRGYDAGAWALALHLARELDAPLLGHHVTRLLVDANRSPGHPAFFSELTRDLPPEERARIVRDHWEPHRRLVRERLDGLLEEAPRVVHVAVHTFTPILRGVVRTADVGLLYDPARAPEARLCVAWQHALRRVEPDLRVRRNYPYRGASDGLTTSLRRALPAARYLGIELEVGQAALASPRERRRVRRALAGTLREALEGPEGALRPPPSPPSRPRPRGAT